MLLCAKFTGYVVALFTSLFFYGKRSTSEGKTLLSIVLQVTSRFMCYVDVKRYIYACT